MVPKRIVDALITSLVKDLGEKSYEQFKTETIHQLKGTPVVKMDKLDNSGSKLSPEGNPSSEVKTDSSIMNEKTVEEDSKLDKRPRERVKQAENNPILDNVLETFAELLHRRLKKLHKKATSRNVHRVLPDLKPTTDNVVGLLKYQEGLLWKQQRRLEHQLAVEEEMLGKKNLPLTVGKKLNKEIGPERTQADENLKPVRKKVPILRQLKTKIRQLHQEKQNLLKKLRMFGLEDDMKSFEDESDVAKVTKGVGGSSVTDIDDSHGRETGTAPYMNSRITYKVLKDEGPHDDTAMHSDTNLEPESHERAVNNYEHLATRAEDHAESELHEHERPGKEIGSNQLFSDQMLSKEIGKLEQFSPFHSLGHFDKLPATPETEKQTSHDSEEHQDTEEHQGQTSLSQNVPSGTLTQPFSNQETQQDMKYRDDLREPSRTSSNSRPSLNVPTYPTPSFINKEASYASDTANMFTKPFLNQESQDNMKYYGDKNRRAHGLIPSYYEQQNNAESDTPVRHNVQKTHNVFPGRYSYGENPTGHEGTPRASQWRQEDAQLMKELPEYAPEDNTIESKSSLPQYTMPVVAQRQSSVQPQPLVTNTAGSDDDERKDGDQEEEHGDESDQFSKKTEDKTQTAFEIVDEAEVPTMRRKTENPEDGVEDKTYINGDEYHIQKKHSTIEKNDKKNGH